MTERLNRPRVRRTGRQARMPGKPREHRHVVKVSDEQEQTLILRAAERRVTVARLLVESALAGGADAAKMRSEFAAELFRALRLLGKIGVNINQIARATNATHEVQAETAAALNALGRVCARIEKLLDDVEVAS